MRRDTTGVKTIDFKYLSPGMKSKQTGKAALNNRVLKWK